MKNCVAEQAILTNPPAPISHMHQCACNGNCGDRCVCKLGSADMVAALVVTSSQKHGRLQSNSPETGGNEDI